MAQGSLYELDSHMQIAADLDYISSDEHKTFIDLEEETGRLLTRSLKRTDPAAPSLVSNL